MITLRGRKSLRAAPHEFLRLRFLHLAPASIPRVVAVVVELPPQLLELARRVGQAVDQHNRFTGLAAMRVKPGAADIADLALLAIDDSLDALGGIAVARSCFGATGKTFLLHM